MSDIEYASDEYEYDSSDPTTGYLFLVYVHDNEFVIDWCRYIDQVHQQFNCNDDNPLIYFICDNPRERILELWNALEQLGYEYDTADRSKWKINSLEGYYQAVDLMQYHAEC